MSKTLNALLLSCFLLAFFTEAATAQSAADSSVYKLTITNLTNQFNQQIGESSRLYNGFIYKPYDAFIKGNAYLDDVTTFRNGSVIYDGESFDNVLLNYDLNTDQVIASLDGRLYRLLSDRVTSFDISNRHFIKITDNKSGIKTGFYEQLYSGRSEVLHRQEKLMHTDRNRGELDSYFAPVNDYKDYYIKRNGRYYKVGDKGSVLDFFSDRKKEIKQFMKANNVQFNGLYEQALVAIANFYDHLSN